MLATEDLTNLHYRVVARGDDVLAGDFEVPSKKDFRLEFKPSLAMVPKASVIVFYIREDGEIISDSLKLEFANELNNFVRFCEFFKNIFCKFCQFQIDVELSKNQAKPGEQLEISVFTKQNSLVGLLGVDQSVLVMKKGNDIEQSTVFEELSQYSKFDKKSHNWHEGTQLEDFKSSDAVLITNAKQPGKLLKS